MLAAVYCRVSTEKDDQINSLESQMSYFLRYIENCPDLTLFQIYADKGISGTAVKNRIRFMQMMEDAEKGLFQVIITKEVSRFSRNILDAVSYSRKLRNLGISIRFMNDGIDTSQPDAELRLSIMASLAQEESRKTSDRVKWGQTRRMEKGVVFGTSMLGYDVKNGKITVNKEGAEIVKKIFNKYVFLHMPASEIAKELHNEGIKTYTGKEKWTPSVIIKILKNEKYCGDLMQKKTFTPDYLTHKKKINKGNEKTIYIKNHHIPIISRELWEAAQNEIKRKSRVKCKNTGKGTKYPLSGKIICASCGSPFVSRKRKDKKGNYTVWKCSSLIKKQNGKQNICNVRYQIRNDNLLYMAEQCFSFLKIDRQTLVDKTVSIINKAKIGLHNSSLKSLTDLDLKRKTLIEKKLNMIDTYFSGNISETEFNLLKQRYESLINRCDLEIHEIKKEHIQNKFILSQIKEYISRKILAQDFSDILIYNSVENIFVHEAGKIQIKLYHLPGIFEFEVYHRKS